MTDKETKISCLIIDDEQEACDRFEQLLKKIPGIEIKAKETNPAEGISKAAALSPDIIFLDVEMPDKTGFDVVKELRGREIFPEFIFVTAYDQYAIKAIRNAAFDFLLKPVDIDDLKDAIIRFKQHRKEKQKIVILEKLRREYNLSDREIEIIELLLKGKTSQEISEILFISRHTVDTHRRNILEKTGTKSTNELSVIINK